MMSVRCWLVLLLLLSPVLGVAQEAVLPDIDEKLIIVTPFETSQASDAMTTAKLTELEEEIRDAATNALGSKGWTIQAARESMYFVGENGPDADASRDHARRFGAGHFISGTLRSGGGELVALIRLHRTETGNVIAAERVRGKSAADILNGAGARIVPLLTNGGLLTGSVAIAPPPPPAPTPAPAPAPTPAPVPKPVKGAGIAAVLPLNVAGTTIDDQTKRALDETIQSYVAKSLSDYGFSVLDSDTTLRYLDENGINAEKVCTANCALAAAKELKASLYLSGSVSKTEGEFVAIIRLYTSSQNGRVLNVAHLEGASVKEIRKAFEAQVNEFVSKALAKLE